MERREKSLTEMQELCLLYENKFKDAIIKNNAVHQL